MLYRFRPVGIHRADTAAGLHDGPLYQPSCPWERHHVIDAGSAAGLAEQGDVVRVSAESADVFADPHKSGQLVLYAEVARGFAFLLKLRGDEIAEDVQPVGDRYHDDAPFAEAFTIVAV